MPYHKTNEMGENERQTYQIRAQISNMIANTVKILLWICNVKKSAENLLVSHYEISRNDLNLLPQSESIFN